MYAGRATHPVFVALAGHGSRGISLPMQLFDDLIKAFEQDQTVTRYRNFEELFEYCRYSANPVGRLVLGLCGYRDAARQALSDATCTALQLANFWQDVTVDLEKDRVYLAAGLAGGTAIRWRRCSRAGSTSASARPCRKPWRWRANCS